MSRGVDVCICKNPLVLDGHGDSQRILFALVTNEAFMTTF
jgi:hypothetical protein